MIRVNFVLDVVVQLMWQTLFVRRVRVVVPVVHVVRTALAHVVLGIKRIIWEMLQKARPTNKGWKLYFTYRTV